MTNKKSLNWIAVSGALLLAILVLVLTFWLGQRSVKGTGSNLPSDPTAVAGVTAAPNGAGSNINIYAHNLRLHQGPAFRVYVQWLRGQLQQSRRGVVPSFDDPESFRLNITNGVIRANIGDICNYLNAKSKDSPLRDIKMSGTGNQIKITGGFHKVMVFPVELDGTLLPAGTNRIQMHISKIDVLKIPMKGLLGSFHLTLESMMGSGKIEGVEVKGNDIFFDPEQLLPPPHIRGNLRSVVVKSPDLEAVYGDVAKDEQRVEEWRNFLRLENGVLRFGKLTMQKVDLMMIDISQDDWFDLDLVNYQAQLVNGYTRMTPQDGLQVFMPDVSQLNNVQPKDISIEWIKNRNVAPPAQVVPKN